jgi:hypothetical protein
VSGRVLAHGRPVTSGTVRLVADLTDGRALEHREAAIDRETGEYRFEQVLPYTVPYRLMAFAPGYAPTEGPRVLVVPPRTDAVRHDIEVREGIPLRGTVLDAATGQPVAGTAVRLVELVANGKRLGPELPMECQSDSAGFFVLGQVAPDARYLGVVADRPDYARAVERLVIPEGALGVDLTLRLHRGATVRVTVSDVDGSRLRGFELHLDGVGTDFRSMVIPGDTGVLERVEPGAYDLAVGIWTHPDASWNGTTLRRSIELAAGESRDERFALGAGGRVRGTIRGPAIERGRRFSAYVLNAQCGYEVWREADADGNYDLRPILPGRKEILVETADGGPRFEERRVVDVVQGGDHVVDFEFPAGGVAGTVKEVRGKPVEGAWVALVPANPSPADPQRRYGAQAAQDGRFAAAGIPPGDYAYEARADGFGVSEGHVTVPVDDKVAELGIELLPEALLRLSVVDRAGAAVPKPDVTVRRDDLRGVRFQPKGVDDAGRHIVEQLTTATYVVAVEAKGLFLAQVPVACRSGVTTDLVVTLRRLGDLEVALRGELGERLAGEPFGLVDRETGESAAAWLEQGRVSSDSGALSTGHDGHVVLRGLPEGEYDVQAVGQSRRVAVTAAERATATIQRVP